MLALFGAYLGNTFRHNSSSMLRKLVHVARLATCWVSVKAEQESKKVVGKKTQGFEPFETQAFHKASKNGVSSFVVRVDTVAGTNENAKAPEVKWKITPEQKERIAGLRHGANFKHFFESCPVKDNTFVVGPALDVHIQRHEDLDEHYPFTKKQHVRVLELAAQAGTPGFIVKLVTNAPAKRSVADMDAYIEAHALIAASIEAEWEDITQAREFWWIYKHHASHEVVTHKDPHSVGGSEAVEKRLAEQDAVYEAEFPEASAKRQEIRRLGQEAKKRVEAMIKAWA